MQKVKITVRLDADQAESLGDVAREEGTTMSFLIRHLVRRFLENKRRMSGIQPPFSPFLSNVCGDE